MEDSSQHSALLNFSNSDDQHMRFAFTNRSEDSFEGADTVEDNSTRTLTVSFVGMIFSDSF